MKALRKFGILSGVVLAGGAIVVPFSTSCGNKVKDFGTFAWNGAVGEWPENIASAVVGYEIAVAVVYPYNDYSTVGVMTYLDLVDLAADHSAWDSPFIFHRPDLQWYAYSGQPGEYTLKIIAIHASPEHPMADHMTYLGYLNVIVTLS